MIIESYNKYYKIY